jgi:hypothetical protein
MLCDKYAVTYVPIDYRARKGKSKIVPWDAGSFAILILRTAMLFRPLRVFVPVVLVCLLYGCAKMTVDVSKGEHISASVILAFVSALVTLLIGMLGDALATRLGGMSSQIAGVRTRNFTIMDEETVRNAPYGSNLPG